jgi:hypothetical protein
MRIGTIDCWAGDACPGRVGLADGESGAVGDRGGIKVCNDVAVGGGPASCEAGLCVDSNTLNTMTTTITMNRPAIHWDAQPPEYNERDLEDLRRMLVNSIVRDDLNYGGM